MKDTEVSFPHHVKVNDPKIITATSEATAKAAVHADALKNARLCWSGPCYAHRAHSWMEKGERYWCPGASTDRT